MRKLNLLLLSVIGLFLFGCNSATGPTSSPDIFVSGNTCLYSDVAYDTSGQSIGTRTDTAIIFSSSISNSQKSILLSDNTMYILDASGSSWILSEVNPRPNAVHFHPFQETQEIL